MNRAHRQRSAEANDGAAPDRPFPHGLQSGAERRRRDYRIGVYKDEKRPGGGTSAGVPCACYLTVLNANDPCAARPGQLSRIIRRA